MTRKQPNALGDPAIEVLVSLAEHISDDVAGRSPTLRRLAVSCGKALSTTYERIQDLNRLGYITGPPYRYGMYNLTAMGWELFESVKAKRTNNERAKKVVESVAKVDSNSDTFEGDKHPATNRVNRKKGGLKNYVSND